MAVLRQLVFALAAGVASHLLYFINGEHHMQAPKLLRLYLLLPLIFFLLELRYIVGGFQESLAESVAVVLCYTTSLFSSIIIYRLFFHRLKHFPGPFPARVSKMYHAWRVRGSDQYDWLEQLHQQYGDFVRTGRSFIIYLPLRMSTVIKYTYHGFRAERNHYFYPTSYTQGLRLRV